MNSAYVKMMATKRQAAEKAKNRRVILGFILMALSSVYILHTVW